MDDQQDEANKLYAKFETDVCDKIRTNQIIAVMRFVLDFWRDPDFWKVLASWS